MTAIEKIIEAINLPKRIIDNAELFLKKLLGPSISEGGQMIADEIRYRRFKNQVVIFSKANDLLKKHSIEPQKVNLKVLHPIMEYASLEEDKDLQNTWANFIANISTHNSEPALDLKCVDILKNITHAEVFFLDYFFLKFKLQEKETLENWAGHPVLKEKKSVSVDNSIFAPWTHTSELKMDQYEIDMYVDRIISAGLMKYEHPQLHESSDDRVIHDYFSEGSKALKLNSYELETSERIHFTAFGLYFVNLCKYG